MDKPVSLSVIGSVNLDIVARGKTLPAPGETVTGATLAKYPGGKGANMALAARRLGADVHLIARVGDDAFAGEALALLKQDGVDLSQTKPVTGTPTGTALIAVSEAGENQIIVASGANDHLGTDDIGDIQTDATLCVLEVDVETVAAAARQANNFFAVNLAPALPVPSIIIERADLIITNEGEAEVYGDALHTGQGIVAVTYGADGAALYKNGVAIAEAVPPDVDVVDTTGAGDTFSAALTIALCAGQSPLPALMFAIAASALAVTKEGAQPSFPWRDDVSALLASANTISPK